jgi:hypothetical protein
VPERIAGTPAQLNHRGEWDGHRNLMRRGPTFASFTDL